MRAQEFLNETSQYDILRQLSKAADVKVDAASKA